MVFGLRKEQNEERAMMVGFKRKKGKQGKNFFFFGKKMKATQNKEMLAS